MSNGMIIYDATQKRAVNLINVDSIRPSEIDGKFVIYFEKLVTQYDRVANHSTIARWDYGTKDLRDHAINLIISAHGRYINSGSDIPVA